MTNYRWLLFATLTLFSLKVSATFVVDTGPLYQPTLQVVCDHLKTQIANEADFSSCGYDHRNTFTPYTSRLVQGTYYKVTSEYRVTAYCNGCTNPSATAYELYSTDDPVNSCAAGETYDFETGQCIPAAQSPEECREAGQYYDPTKPEGQECVTECANGAMDNQCLTTPDPTCSEASADYQGTVGWGEDHRPVCSGDTSCGDNERFAYREMNDGSWGGVCVSNESNPPTCPYGFKGVLEIYDNGFACGPLNEDKASDKNDSSDGDSDGDGQADDNGIAGQLEDIKGLLRDGNNEVGNIGQSLKKGFGDLKDAIGNIPGGGGGDSGSGQTEIVGEDGNAITWSGEAITMEVQDGLDQLNAVQGEYESLIANIRSEMSASFGSFTGAGGLQDNNITLFGQTFNAGFSKFGADLSMIGSIILFAASFAALGIIMGARD